MKKRYISLLALPLLSIAACLDMSDQDSTDGTSSQAAEAAALAGSPQAGATVIGTICETYGSHFCVGAPTIAFEDPVVETANGRSLEIVDVPGGVVLAFNAPGNKCVAVKNASTLVEVRSCDVASAVWIRQTGPDGHSCIFEATSTSTTQPRTYLAGPNRAGGQFSVVSKPPPTGWLQQFICG